MKSRLTLVATALMVTACGTSSPEPGAVQPNASPPPAERAESATPGGPTGDGAPRTVQAGAPGEASRVLDADEVASLGAPSHHPADVRFMQGMIPHHAQAVEMVALMPGRTENPRLQSLGQRIEISQIDEIALMARWLEDRGEAVPGGRMGHGSMDGGLMPGMLTPAEMEELAAATGLEFDRLFLQFMISHHEGALVMVQELFATPGAGQETFANKFAGDVDADQTMEILSMQQMLDESR